MPALKRKQLTDNVLVADSIRASLEPVILSITTELSKAQGERPMALKGTRLLVDGLLALTDASAEIVHVDGVQSDDVGFLPLSTQLMALCIYGHATGLSFNDLQSVLRVVWDRAVEMGVLPHRGH